LDSSHSGAENFHLIFLVLLSRHLGFGPQQRQEILGGRLLDPIEEVLLQELIESDFHSKLVMTNLQRRNILDILLHFYSIHIDTFGELKSLQVLREVLH
jgi:DNA repair protein RecO (recombination protein O)